MSANDKRRLRPIFDEYEALVLMSSGPADGILSSADHLAFVIRVADLLVIRQQWRHAHPHQHLHPLRKHHHRRSAPSAPVSTTPVATPPVSAPPVTNPPVTVPAVPGVLTAIEQQIVSLTNQDRAASGLPALIVSTKLVDMAEIHSRDMAQLQDMEHTLPGATLATLANRASYVGYQASWLGENIALGYPDATSVMEGWMNSPPHEANILNPNFTEIGVAVAYDSAGEPYYTQVFGHPA